MERMEGSLGKKMEGLLEKVEGRLEKWREPKDRGISDEGKETKRREREGRWARSCLHIINVYDFFITSSCATAMSKCCLW